MVSALGDQKPVGNRRWPCSTRRRPGRAPRAHRLATGVNGDAVRNSSAHGESGRGGRGSPRLGKTRHESRRRACDSRSEFRRRRLPGAGLRLLSPPRVQCRADTPPPCRGRNGRMNIPKSLRCRALGVKSRRLIPGGLMRSACAQENHQSRTVRARHSARPQPAPPEEPQRALRAPRGAAVPRAQRRLPRRSARERPAARQNQQNDRQGSRMCSCSCWNSTKLW